jgi:hypothetical protein
MAGIKCPACRKPMPEPAPEKCPSCNCSYEALSAVDMPAAGKRAKSPVAEQVVETPEVAPSSPQPEKTASTEETKSSGPRPEVVLSIKGKGAVDAFNQLIKRSGGQLIFIVTEGEKPERDGEDSWVLMRAPL